MGGASSSVVGSPVVGSPVTSALERGAPLLLALLVLLAWGSAIVRGGFAYDDREVLFDNPVVEGALPWSSVVDRDYWHHIGDAGHWRPLATATLRIDRWLYGTDSRGYHATNVALHGAVVMLAALLARRLALALGAPFPWFGLALFAAHPLLADSVAWISGRTSMLSALGGLAGALAVASCAAARVASTAGAAARGGPPSAGRTVCLTGASALGLGAALMGKEDALAFAVVLPLVALATAGPGRRLAASAWTLAGCGLAVSGWLAARYAALGVAFPTAPHAPLAEAPLTIRLAHGLAAWGEGLAATLVPSLSLPPNLTVADVATPGLSGRVALFAAFAAGALWFGWRGRRRALRDVGALGGSMRLVEGCLCCVLAALAPLIQLVPSGELFAPRFLYLPLLLGAPATSALLAAVVPRPGPRRVTAALALSACVLLAQVHSARYASRLAFWESHLPRHAADPRVWNELGNAAREAGDLVAARASFERAVTLAPGYSRAWVNLGTLALRRDDLEVALEQLQRAVAVGQENAVAHANLGNAWLRAGEAAQAAAAYQRAVALAPGRAAFWRGLARARPRG
ncbi:MAG: tetratricopeptide repeat protein [Planctomycetota bacterium]